MGLFDFAKNIGNKLFNKDATPEDAAAAIKKEIEAAKLNIDGLTVEVKDDLCTLGGNCPTAEAMQKAVLIAGNVKEIENVSAANLRVAGTSAQDLADKSVQYYLIQSGDNLSKIAKAFYGDANKYPAIFDANREVIKNPDLIFPGQKIRIPQLS